MRLAAVERWRVERVAPPVPEPWAAGGYTIRVAGRSVAIRPNPSYDRVRGHEVGKDGSVLVHRWSYGVNSVLAESILFKGADHPVAEGLVSQYRDRLDDAGAYVEPSAGLAGPETASPSTWPRRATSC